MSLPPLSALKPAVVRDPAQERVTRLAGWANRPEPSGPTVAVLLTGCRDAPAVVRGYRTLLPGAVVWLFGTGFGPEDASAAEAAGAVVRIVPPSTREALVRRMLAEADADISLLVHGGGIGDVCVAPLVVSEVEAGKDLVDVCRLGGGAAADAGDRLLGRTANWVFGPGGDILRSDFKACSRRFALSYRRTPPRAGDRDEPARALALHALRLRLPVGQVATLGERRGGDARPRRGLAGWVALLRLVLRLLVEERPRRVFGLLGLFVMAGGVAVALPVLHIHHWQATTTPGSRIFAASLLLASGAAAGAAGILLDSLASARQEVRRLGVAAIPRRAERSGASDQSSVS